MKVDTQFLSFWIKRSYRVIFEAKRAWDVINRETPSELFLFQNYALPWLICCVLVKSLFAVIYASEPTFTLFFLIFVTSSVSYFGGYFMSCYFSAVIVRRYFKPNAYREDIYKLVTYCLTVVWALDTVIAIIPEVRILSILKLYMVYLLWVGGQKIVGISEQDMTTLVIILTLVLLFSVPVINFFMGMLLPNADL